MYTALPDRLNCSSIGSNSPVILRFEVATESGGMMIEEFHNARSMVKLYGDVSEAKAQFVTGLEGFAEYLNLAHYGQPTSGCWASPRWFQVEYRQPPYRATLYGEGERYRFSYMFSNPGYEIQPLIDGLVAAHARLKTVYEMFFDTRL